MKFITPTIHGMLDYMAALALIVAPFILGLEQLALWLSVIAGVGLIMYSLMTDYAYSIAKAIPFGLHIALDSTAAVFFIIAPFIFGFEGITAIYYWVMGAGVAMVVLFTALQQPAKLES